MTSTTKTRSAFSIVVRAGVLSLLLAGASDVRSQTTQRPPTKLNIETEVVEFGRFGFIPPKIVRSKPGRFILYIRDTTGADFSVDIQRADGVRLPPGLTNKLQARGGGRLARISDVIDMPASKYILRSAVNSKLSLEIEVKE